MSWWMRRNKRWESQGFRNENNFLMIDPSQAYCSCIRMQKTRQDAEGDLLTWKTDGDQVNVYFFSSFFYIKKQNKTVICRHFQLFLWQNQSSIIKKVIHLYKVKYAFNETTGTINPLQGLLCVSLTKCFVMVYRSHVVLQY